MEKVTLKVNGMTCGHCEKAVVNAIEDAGASPIKVCREQSTAELEFDPAKVSLDAIKAEIVDAGYEIA